MQRLKERLITRRNRLNLSQKELAEKSGVSERSIAAYELGESQPTSRILEKLATALGWKPADFYADPPAEKLQDKPESVYTSSSEETELWKTRAIAAEQTVEMLRNGMRRLVDASSGTPLRTEPGKPSSLPASPGEYDAAAVVGKQVNHPPGESPVPFLTGGRKKGATGSPPQSAPPSRTPHPEPPKPGKA